MLNMCLRVDFFDKINKNDREVNAGSPKIDRKNQIDDLSTKFDTL